MLSRQEKRLNRILKMLKLLNPATVNNLASAMEVSHMTIRRDLELLKKRKLVEIFHGGVVLRNDRIKENQHPYSLSYANKQMNPEKKHIAVKAASLVNNNDTIIIDTGSTTEYLARSLPDGLAISVICFTLNTLIPISKLEKANIIFPGGYCHKNTLMFESSECKNLISGNPADMVFISASGISIELGVSCSNEYELDTKKEIMKSAETKILLADSSKFDKVKSTSFAKCTDFDILITDKRIPDRYREYCKANGIELIIV